MNKKGFILPMVIFSMMIISILSITSLTFLMTTKMTNKLQSKNINDKKIFEQILYDLKNGNEFNTGTGEKYEGFEIINYNVTDKDDGVTPHDEIKAISAKRGETIIFVTIYDSTPSSEKTLLFSQKSNPVETELDGSFIFDSYKFTPVAI